MAAPKPITEQIKPYQVFRYIASGMTEQEVADRLGVHPTVISRRLQRVYDNAPGLRETLGHVKSVHRRYRDLYGELIRPL